MTIIKVDETKFAEHVLYFIGNNFFKGERLQKFIQSHLSSLSPISPITFKHLVINGNKNVELWAFIDSHNRVIGAMTLNYYSWRRLSRQFYFSTTYYLRRDAETVSVVPFSQLITEHTIQVETIQIAVELGYFAVAEMARGQGIGRQLFERFLNRVEESPVVGRLAFVIVMGKYSKSFRGDTLMKHLLRNGPEIATQPVVLKVVLDELGLPEDIFALDTGAIPTAKLAEEYGFSKVGHGRYLGQVWVKRI